MDSSQLFEHLHTAMLLEHLAHPEGLRMNVVLSNGERILEYLKTYNFKSVLTHTHRLRSQLDFLKKDNNSNSYKYDHGIPKEEAFEIKRILSPIFDALLDYSKEIEIVFLNKSAVSDHLQKLHESISLNENQLVLRDEVVRCMECGAYRSGMVMAWNLAFDYIRSWIFSDTTRLAAFNGVLTTKDKKKGLKHSPIADYEAFFSLKESDVLQWSLEAWLINDKVLRALVEWLDRRNDYAHPSFKHPKPEQAMGKISELLDVIEHPPFK